MVQTEERDTVSKKQERKKRRARHAADANREKRYEEYRSDTQRYRDEYVVRGARSNRFMLVRYLSAVVFCINLSWMVVLMYMRTWGIVVPIVGALAGGIACVECMVAVARDNQRLKISEVLYPVSAVLYVVAALLTPLAGKDLFFPFLSQGIYGIALCAICIAVEAIIIVRLRKIRNRTDKRYARYAQVSAEAAAKSS